MFKSLKKQRNRKGTAAVEFAVVAPVFFLTIFACIEFSRFWTAETFVESAVFQTARDLSVFGAKIDEGRPFAANVLSPIGITQFDITVTPFEDGTTQSEITDTTTHIQVTVEVPASEVSYLNAWFVHKPITRSAESITNRPN